MQDIKIMVVDDESRMRKLVRDFLTREGYKVIEAGDGEEAVDLLMPMLLTKFKFSTAVHAMQKLLLSFLPKKILH